MEELRLIESPLYPPHIINFPIPNDPALKSAYVTYKPSAQTIQLLSEQRRTVYADAFIENINLGTLAHLCVRVLARSFGPDPIPIVAIDPLLLQVHYDALDVELPLIKCYHINEDRFWRRVVLAKHKDKSLAFKTHINWKQLGVSLKFVEMLEECPAEYWPQEEMKDLSLKVKEFIKELHIKHLQSLRERSFEKYFHSESENSGEESDEEMDNEITSSLESALDDEDISEEGKTESQIELYKELAEQRAQRKKERLELRETKQKAREIKETKRKLYEARKLAAEAEEEENPVKKVTKKKIVDFFNIELSESEGDGEDRIIDKRNKALLLKHLKKYNYPSKDCHHIDLRFVQYFTNLQIFKIEFWGPLQGRNYHIRHQNFSYHDITNLAVGLRHLPQLHTFHLRNSRMDAKKLFIICKALGALLNLESLDFGNDQLEDDCGYAFVQLFLNTKTLRYLELENNRLAEQVLLQIGKALRNYNTNQLIYLGLARNPLTDQALHTFVSLIMRTNHIVELNIRGAKHLTEKALCCCLANELLKEHTALVKLDICAIKVSTLAANEIIKSLVKNEKLLVLYCCACDLDEESEIDINVLLQRNKYIAENDYLGDATKTKEEIEKWLNRTRNPILLKVLAERENQNQCIENRSIEFIPSRDSHTLMTEHHGSLDIKSHMYETQLNESSTSSESVGTSKEQLQPHFIYPANEFDEQEFLEHVYQPGPQDRYYYFQACKKNYGIKDNIKNISMI